MRRIIDLKYDTRINELTILSTKCPASSQINVTCRNILLLFYLYQKSKVKAKCKNRTDSFTDKLYFYGVLGGLQILCMIYYVTSFKRVLLLLHMQNQR